MYKSLLRAAVVAAHLAMAGAANASFMGSFDLSNWTFTNSAGNDGSVVLTAPTSFQLNGGNNGTALGTADFTVVVPTAGQVSFQWSYATDDVLSHPDCSAIPGDYCDPAYLLVNGVETQLSFSNPDWANEIFSLDAGDVFGFRVRTADGDFGRGHISVGRFDFSPGGAAAVPEPSTTALLGLALAGLGLVRRRRKA